MWAGSGDGAPIQTGSREREEGVGIVPDPDRVGRGKGGFSWARVSPGGLWRGDGWAVWVSGWPAGPLGTVGQGGAGVGVGGRVGGG